MIIKPHMRKAEVFLTTIIVLIVLGIGSKFYPLHKHTHDECNISICDKECINNEGCTDEKCRTLSCHEYELESNTCDPR